MRGGDRAAGVAREECQPVLGHGCRRKNASRRLTRFTWRTFPLLLCSAGRARVCRLMGPGDKKEMWEGVDQCDTLWLPPNRHELPAVRSVRPGPRRAPPLRVVRGVARQARPDFARRRRTFWSLPMWYCSRVPPPPHARGSIGNFPKREDRTRLIAEGI